MNELRWTELAGHVVAWHNRNPLARRISVQHVHSLGYVMLPFAGDTPTAAAAGPARAARAAAGAEPLPPEAMTGSLRERAMARAQLEAQGASAHPDDSPAKGAAPAQLRPAFNEDFLPPHSPKAVRRWAAHQAVAQTTPRGDVQVRKVKAEAGLSEAEQLPRWVLTAQVEVDGARTRVLVGPGAQPAVLGRRLISPVRILSLCALAGVLAGLALWVRGLEPGSPGPKPAAAASAVSAPASASRPGSAASAARLSVAVATSQVTASAPPQASAPTHAPVPTPMLATQPASAAISAPPAAVAAPAPRPLDAEPRLGQIDLPSLGPRIDARRRRAQEAAASAAEAASGAPAAPVPAASGPARSAAPVQAVQPPPTAMPAPGGPSFAVATRLLRTRSESEQVASAIRELLSKQPGPPVRVEVLAAGDDWRVVGWPYTDRALADKARALLAARGMKVQVIDF